MAIKVVVTKADIKKAQKEVDAKRQKENAPPPIPIDVETLCPIVQALKRQGRETPIVNNAWISFEGKFYHIPMKVRNWMWEWDHTPSNHQMNPISFYLRRA